MFSLAEIDVRLAPSTHNASALGVDRQHLPLLLLFAKIESRDLRDESVIANDDPTW
jgi:hypothetical protein